MFRIMEVIRNILNVLNIFLIFIILMLIKWYNVTFSEVGIEQLLFHVIVPLDGADSNVFMEFFSFSKTYIVVMIIFIIAIIIYQSKIFQHSYSININTKFINKKHNIIWKIKDDRNYILLFSVIMLFIVIAYSFQALDVKTYISNNINDSKFIEENYVDPRNVKLTFPKQKQNLIYIYLESMESTYSNMDLKYVNQVNLIPNLTKLANDNINFSHNDTIGGALSIHGTEWTIAGMVAQTSGIPLKIPMDGNALDGYKDFLPGSYSLGEILKKEGYNQLLLLGSKSDFGGRANYFLQHGNYQIYDYYTAIENNKIPSDYFLNWGIEDLKLFDIAKEELIRLSKKSEPFNFTMLTVDTHFPYGYSDESCGEGITNNEYANAVICSDSKVAEFVSWIEKQDFYKNTTIIISGDHLVMGNYLYTDGSLDNRSIYNVIINSKVNATNTKNRIFTTMDMYPTTLASMGVKIEGERLGLGTNLYSDVKTLPEELDYGYFNEELAKKSKYYNQYIMTRYK